MLLFLVAFVAAILYPVISFLKPIQQKLRILTIFIIVLLAVQAIFWFTLMR